MSERKIDNSPELAWIEEHLGDVVLVAGEKFNGLKLMLRQGPTWVGLARVLRDYHAHQLISKPTEAPAPSQTECAWQQSPCPLCGKALMHAISTPQAAQTVASPTAELKHKALLHLKNWLRNDITPYHDRDTDCLNATFDQWIEQLSAFAADYAATLEARVANWRKHYHIVSDKWTAAEKRAEKAGALVVDQQATFDLMWAADQRAIKQWQEATGQDHIWPDRAKLTTWLLERADALAISLRDVGDTLTKIAKATHEVYTAKAIARLLEGVQ